MSPARPAASAGQHSRWPRGSWRPGPCSSTSIANSTAQAGTTRPGPARAAGSGADEGAAGPARLRRLIRRQRAFAEAMHRAHPVPRYWPDWCAADTLLCRCEEVSVGTATRAATELGAASARDQKLLTRCGWAGARAGAAVRPSPAYRPTVGREVIADDLRAMAKRTFAIPVPLSELARLADPSEEP